MNNFSYKEKLDIDKNFYDKVRDDYYKKTNIDIYESDTYLTCAVVLNSIQREIGEKELGIDSWKKQLGAFCELNNLEIEQIPFEQLIQIISDSDDSRFKEIADCARKMKEKVTFTLWGFISSLK